MAADELSKEKVRRLLRQAFPPLSERPDLRPLSHDEARYMRTRLAGLRNEDVPYYLVQVLEDLLDFHTNRSGDSEDAEGVVQYLNVGGRVTDHQGMESRGSKMELEEAREEEEVLRQGKRERVRGFTLEQAYAVSKWLECARAWEDLRWYATDIDAALSYWRKRFETA